MVKQQIAMIDASSLFAAIAADEELIPRGAKYRSVSVDGDVIRFRFTVPDDVVRFEDLHVALVDVTADA